MSAVNEKKRQGTCMGSLLMFVGAYTVLYAIFLMIKLEVFIHALVILGLILLCIGYEIGRT